MSNDHQEKYITKLLFGFTFVIAATLVTFYACFERTKYDDWYFWGLIAAFLLCIGIYLLLKAFVHKMKSDLIKRQKQREQQKTFTAD
jgi:hypothetical protein